MNALKRVLAVCTGLLLAVGLALGGATAAHAHAGDIKVHKVECDPTTGEYVITFKLSWSNVPSGVTADIKSRTGTTSFDGGWSYPGGKTWTDRGKTSGTSGSTTWQTRLPGTTKGNGPWEYAYTKWSNGHNGALKHDTRAEGLGGNCEQKLATADVKVGPATCDAPGVPALFNVKNAVLNGSLDTSVGTHTAKFTATSGHLFSNGTNKLEVTYTVPPKDPSKCAKDAAATINVSPGTCEAPGSASIGTVNHATWDGQLATLPGTHTETFTATPGHLFSDGKQTLVVTYTIPPKNESLCPKDANATITVTPATCEAPGSAAIGTVQHATWDGKLETEPGDHSETFTAVAGHFFANGEKTLVVNYTIPPKDTSLCPTDAVATITVAPGTCEAPGSASIGELEHATWDGKLETEPGSYTETFTATPGHLFSNGKSTLEVNYTIPPKDASTCPKDAVATITVTPGTCAAPGSASIGTVEHATWDGQLETEPGTHFETFTAEPGHLFSNGTTTLAVSYTIPPKDPTLCPTATECEVLTDGGVSTNEAPNGWSGDGAHTFGAYELEVTGDWDEAWISRAVNLPLKDVLDSLDIEATPIQYVGLHFVTSDDRVIVFEEEPSYGGKLWSTSAFAGVPAGMGYAAFGTPDEFAAQNADLVITSVKLLYTSPTESSTLIESVTFGCKVFTFDLVFDPPTKPIVAAAVVFGQMTCDADGTITLSHDQAPANAVIWTVNGASASDGVIKVTTAGTVTVTAAPNAPDYGFDEQQKREWEFTFVKPEACGDLPTLALSGSDSAPLWLTGAGVLLLAGLGLSFAMRTRTEKA